MVLGILNMSIIHHKYPRTLHLPWSLSMTTDDKILKDTSSFQGREIIVTVKQDGENTSLYRDHFHARSLDSRHHPSRNWIRDFHEARKEDIPENFRICGENLYASHSIYYKNLPSYFMAFSLWDNENNSCLSWDETLDYLELLDIVPVPVIYRGLFNETSIKDAWEAYCKEAYKSPDIVEEGYVVRSTESFHYKDFKKNVTKFVRKGHVQTSEHWMSEKIIPNSLMSDLEHIKESRYKEFKERMERGHHSNQDIQNKDKKKTLKP
jgi:hypothetical protein